MNHERLSDALSQLGDRHIMEATKPRRRGWISALAAVLAVAIGLGLLLRPGIQPEVSMQAPSLPTETVLPTQADSHYRLAAASYPKVAKYPGEYDYNSYFAWSEGQKALHNQPEGYADSLQICWEQLVPALLSGDGKTNSVCSPLNIYMALAMLAECTDGDTRQQLLDLLNAGSIDASRLQAGQVWKAHYNNDGLSKSVLGSSLWLQEGYGFDPAMMISSALGTIITNNLPSFVKIFSSEKVYV